MDSSQSNGNLSPQVCLCVTSHVRPFFLNYFSATLFNVGKIGHLTTIEPAMCTAVSYWKYYTGAKRPLFLVLYSTQVWCRQLDWHWSSNFHEDHTSSFIIVEHWVEHGAAVNKLHVWASIFWPCPPLSAALGMTSYIQVLQNKDNCNQLHYRRFNSIIFVVYCCS